MKLRVVLAKVRYELENCLILLDEALYFSAAVFSLILGYILGFLSDPTVQLILVYGVLFCVGLYL